MFVAGFIGSPAMNIIEAPLIDGNIRLGNKSVPLPEAAAKVLTERGRTSVIMGMRPEDLRITDSETAWPVEVQLVEGLGADAYVYTEVQLPGGGTKQVVVRTDGRQHPARGSHARPRSHPPPHPPLRPRNRRTPRLLTRRPATD